MDNIKNLCNITHWTDIFHSDYWFFKGLYIDMITNQNDMRAIFKFEQFIEEDILWKK